MDLEHRQQKQISQKLLIWYCMYYYVAQKMAGFTVKAAPPGDLGGQDVLPD